MAPDTVGFGPIQWRQNPGPNSDLLQVNGFSGSYGGSQVVSPGDQITLTAWSQSTGKSSGSSRLTVTAPFPSIIASQSYQPNRLFAGKNASITGKITDRSACAIEGAFVALTASAGAVQPPVVSLSDGTFSTSYTAPATAGWQTLTAQTQGAPPLCRLLPASRYLSTRR